jgi:hypothetical protein
MRERRAENRGFNEKREERIWMLTKATKYLVPTKDF